MKPRLFGRTQSDMNLDERMKQAAEFNRRIILEYFKTSQEIKQFALNNNEPKKEGYRK